MGTFRAYHKETTRYLAYHPKVRTDKTIFATAAAAKAAITREARRGAINAEDFAIADSGTFHSEIEKTKTVKNLMSGADVEQSVNTPHCCDPSTETYWSM